MPEDRPRPKIGAAIDKIIEILEQFDNTQRQTIIAAVSSQLELGPTPRPLQAPVPFGAAPSTPPSQAPESESKLQRSLRDIRSLKEDKNPKSAQQMVAVAGYYLQEVESDGSGNDVFTAADMNKLFRQAGYPLPQSMKQTLVNAKNAGYLDTTSTRGSYKLSRVGYNLVTHSMPTKKS